MDFDAWYQAELSGCSDLGMKPWLRSYENARSVFEDTWPAPAPKQIEVSEAARLRAEVAALNARLQQVEHMTRSADGLPVTEREDALLDAIGDAIGILNRKLSDRIDALEVRLAAEEEHTSSTGAIGSLVDRVCKLEEKPHLAYRGGWDEQQRYEPGDLVTRSGSAWCCMAATTGIEPTTHSNGIWRVFVARGRSGKDAKPVEPAVR